MEEKLLINISTLVVKLPDYLILPVYNDRFRMRKAIIRSIIDLLQTRTLELLYVGNKQFEEVNYFDALADADDTTIICINVIENRDMHYNFTGSYELPLKHFKKELVYNSEHILIDHSQTVMGKKQRLIEIYINSRHAQRKADSHYMLSGRQNYHSSI